jgi:hypothetical protein
MQSRQTCKIIPHTPEYKTILNIKYASNLSPRPFLPPLSSNSSETLTLGTNPTGTGSFSTTHDFLLRKNKSIHASQHDGGQQQEEIGKHLQEELGWCLYLY